MAKRKSKRWTHGLVFSDTELEATADGRSSEAYEYTYPGWDITPSSHRRGARKELRKRYRKRG